MNDRQFDPIGDNNLQEHILQFLQDIVNIDSRTDNASGVNYVQGLFQEELNKLGLHCQRLDNPHINSGQLLLGQSGAGKLNVALVCHADTAQSLTKAGEFKLNVSEDKASGNGLLDDKGGMAILLGALTLFKKRYPYHRLHLKVISSPNEEKGSRGFEESLLALGQKVDIGLGLEPGQFDHSLITSRSGNRWYQVFIKGKSGHSGRFDSPSVSAVHEAVTKIHELLKLQDLDKLIRLNIGQIESGSDRFNVVCDQASFKLDFRFPNNELRDRIHQDIVKILGTSYTRCHVSQLETSCTHTIEDDCPSMANCHQQVYDVVKHWRLPGEPSPQVSFCGGASDLNYLSRKGNVVLDGLGAYGSGMHTEVETVSVSQVFIRIHKLYELLSALEQQHWH